MAPKRGAAKTKARLESQGYTQDATEVEVGTEFN